MAAGSGLLILLSELGKGQHLLLGRVDGRRRRIRLIQPGPEIAMCEQVHPLQACIPFDPPGVFLKVGRAVRTGSDAGYQYESLGVNLFVGVVEQYLAEYPGLFATDTDCRRVLIETLDVFVKVGWPEARRLAYRLGDLFR